MSYDLPVMLQGATGGTWDGYFDTLGVVRVPARATPQPPPASDSVGLTLDSLPAPESFRFVTTFYSEDNNTANAHGGRVDAT